MFLLGVPPVIDPSRTEGPPGAVPSTGLPSLLASSELPPTPALTIIWPPSNESANTDGLREEQGDVPASNRCVREAKPRWDDRRKSVAVCSVTQDDPIWAIRENSRGLYESIDFFLGRTCLSTGSGATQSINSRMPAKTPLLPCRGHLRCNYEAQRC
jgi:hypothetical protein